MRKQDKGSDAGAVPFAQQETATPAAHTPGPWGWYGEDFSQLILCRNGDPFEGHVLTMTMCRSCHDSAKAEKREDWHWGDCHTATQANARLISAAPEMYEALVEAQEAIVQLEAFSNTPDVARDPVWRRVRATGAAALRSIAAVRAKATTPPATLETGAERNRGTNSTTSNPTREGK